MYKTINGWTKERMKAQIELKNNGSRSEYNGHCKYRTPNGNACAVGCFIPDDIYNKIANDIEGMPVDSIADIEDLHQHFPLTIAGMGILQNVHDMVKRNLDVRDVLCAWIDENVEDS